MGEKAAKQSVTGAVIARRLAKRLPQLPEKEVTRAVQIIFECMTRALYAGQNVEIRGFGSFRVKQRAARKARNARTGAKVRVPAKRALGFRPGKEMRETFPQSEGAQPETVAAKTQRGQA